MLKSSAGDNSVPGFVACHEVKIRHLATKLDDQVASSIEHIERFFFFRFAIICFSLLLSMHPAVII